MYYDQRNYGDSIVPAHHWGEVALNAEVVVDATIYHAVEGQTDSTPLICSSGKHINPESCRT